MPSSVRSALGILPVCSRPEEYIGRNRSKGSMANVTGLPSCAKDLVTTKVDYHHIRERNILFCSFSCHIPPVHPARKNTAEETCKGLETVFKRVLDVLIASSRSYSPAKHWEQITSHLRTEPVPHHRQLHIVSNTTGIPGDTTTVAPFNPLYGLGVVKSLDKTPNLVHIPQTPSREGCPVRIAWVASIL